MHEKEEDGEHLRRSLLRSREAAAASDSQPEGPLSDVLSIIFDSRVSQSEHEPLALASLLQVNLQILLSRIPSYVLL